MMLLEGSGLLLSFVIYSGFLVRTTISRSSGWLSKEPFAVVLVVFVAVVFIEGGVSGTSLLAATFAHDCTSSTLSVLAVVAVSCAYLML